MNDNAYWGILSSPFAPSKQRERTLRKARKSGFLHNAQRRYPIGPDTSLGHGRKKWGHLSIFLFPNVHGKQVSFSNNIITMELVIEKNTCVLTHDGSEIFSGSYRDCRKIITSIRQQVEKKADEEYLRLPEVNLKNPPDWLGFLVEKKEYKPISCFEFHIGIAVGGNVSIRPNAGTIIYQRNLSYVQILDGVVSWYPNDAKEDILEAYAAAHGLLYLPKSDQSFAGEKYGFYNLSSNWTWSEEGYDATTDTVFSRKYRTNSVSQDGIYRIRTRTDKTVWVDPVSVKIH